MDCSGWLQSYNITAGHTQGITQHSDGVPFQVDLHADGLDLSCAPLKIKLSLVKGKLAGVQDGCWKYVSDTTVGDASEWQVYGCEASMLVYEQEETE